MTTKIPTELLEDDAVTADKLADGAVTTDRLADGAITLPKMSTTHGALSGFRNKIINGCCRVAQRGNVAAVNNSMTYGGADRIAVFPASFTTFTGTIQQSTTSNNTASNYAQSVTGVTTTGTGAVHFAQRIEAMNTRDLAGKTITVSARVYHDVGSAVTMLASLYKANSTDDFSANTQIGSNASLGNAASGSYTTVSAQFTLGSSDANTGLMVFISFTSIGAVSSKAFYVGDLQVTAGDTALPFEFRPFSTELALCQRYYEKSFTQGVAPAQNVGSIVGAFQVPQVAAASTGVSFGTVYFKTTKRTAPTVTFYNPSAANGQMRNSSTGVDCSGTSAVATGDASFSITATTGAGTAIGGTNAVHWAAACEL